jgi:hypothetical protein
MVTHQELRPWCLRWRREDLPVVAVAPEAIHRGHPEQQAAANLDAGVLSERGVDLSPQLCDQLIRQARTRLKSQDLSLL